MVGILLLASSCLFGRYTAAVSDDFARGASPEIALEATAAKVEQWRIRLENRPGGAIAVSSDRGAAWERVGTVAHPATAVNEMGYTASKWAADGSVAATAVNAVHIKVRHNTAKDRGVVFSILPRIPSESHVGGQTTTSVGIDTDVAAGTGIFGSLAPVVGNPVYLETAIHGPVGHPVSFGESSRNSTMKMGPAGSWGPPEQAAPATTGGPTGRIFEAYGQLTPLPRDHIPDVGDVFVIVVERSIRPPLSAVFENKFGGIVYLEYLDGQRRAVGAVLRPVLGVGRFPGTAYAAVGRIRANHCGVIDISTSPYGEVGGFQIVPKGHAGSPETHYVRTETQWMVIGPLNALDPSWEGVPPFFSSFLGPYFSSKDLTAGDWLDRYLGRVRVDVRLNGGPWERMPAYSLDPRAALPAGARTALGKVTHIRIHFPLRL